MSDDRRGLVFGVELSELDRRDVPSSSFDDEDEVEDADRAAFSTSSASAGHDLAFELVAGEPHDQVLDRAELIGSSWSRWIGAESLTNASSTGTP